MAVYRKPGFAGFLLMSVIHAPSGLVKTFYIFLDTDITSPRFPQTVSSSISIVIQCLMQSSSSLIRTYANDLISWYMVENEFVVYTR